MPSKQVVFSDRVVGLSFQNGLVRIDLAVATGTTKTKEDKPAVRLETTHQLVMPLEGFVAAVAAQEKLVRGLAAQQKKRREAKAKTTESAPAAPAAG